MRKLSIAVAGCGARAVTYLSEAMADLPGYFEVVAGADPVSSAVEQIAVISRNPNFMRFSDVEGLLANERLADILLIATQDHMHFAPCLRAMRMGYDILLEKPIATKLHEVLALEAEAERLGRRVMLCHVYRFAPFYETVKSLLSAGAIGDIVAVNASEGVGPWHQAHSFVRGKWSVAERATPMILAKCCHDMDFLSWLIDEPCISVASTGSLGYFVSANAPAGAPARCTDGCPAGGGCAYNALRYAGDKRHPWLPQIMAGEAAADSAAIVDWLRKSPWGRCVYRCDNDAVDRQALLLTFGKGITCTFTMTAFDHGRSLEIFGTKGTIKAGEALGLGPGRDIVVRTHETGRELVYDMKFGPTDYIHHEGGDSGLVRSLHDEMLVVDRSAMRSSISRAVQSHVIAFAAEEARLTGTVVALDKFVSRVMTDTAT